MMQLCEAESEVKRLVDAEMSDCYGGMNKL